MTSAIQHKELTHKINQRIRELDNLGDQLLSSMMKTG